MANDDTSKLVISKIKQIDDTTLQNYGLKNENEFYLITDDKLPIDVGDKKIVLSANATNDHDVINKSYIDDRLSKSGLLHNIELNSGVEKVNNLNPVNGNINVYNLVRPLADGTTFLKLINEETYEVIDQIALSSDLTYYVSHVQLNQRLPAEFETRLKPYILINTWNTENGARTQTDINYLSTNITNVSSISDEKRKILSNDLTNIINVTSVQLSTQLTNKITELSNKTVFLTGDQNIGGNKQFNNLIKYTGNYNQTTFLNNSTPQTLTPKQYIQDVEENLNSTINSGLKTLNDTLSKNITELSNTTVKLNINQTINSEKTFTKLIKYNDYQDKDNFNSKSTEKTLVPRGYVTDIANDLNLQITNLDSNVVKITGDQNIEGTKKFKQYINYINKYVNKDDFNQHSYKETLVPKQYILDIEAELQNQIRLLTETRMARNIGDIFYTTRLDVFQKNKIVMNGAVLCDGREYDISDTNLKYYFTEGLIAYKTYDDFGNDSSLNKNNFGYFQWNPKTNKVKVPKLDHIFIQSEISASKWVGHYLAAGLPNIKAFGFMGEAYSDWNNYGEGALRYMKKNGSGHLGSHGGQDRDNFAGDFNAARCNPIYGRSDTVQPPTIRLAPMVQIANEVKHPDLLHADELINQFNDVLANVNELMNKLVNKTV